MSWIERDDLVRLIAHIIATPSLTGAVNATAPAPVTNAEFTGSLARALGRPAVFRVPAFVLHHIAGALADEVLLGGQRVLPDKAQMSGFAFRHETLASALDAVLGNAPASEPAAPPLASTVSMNSVDARSAPPEQSVDQPAVEPAARLLRSLRLRTR
jgi:hypothetical protein